MQFTLPVPPSANNLFFSVHGKGRAPTKQYWAWQHEADMEIMAQRRGQSKMPSPVQITITAPSTNGRSDLDNRIKAINDALVRMGVIEDDNDQHVKRIIVQVGAPPGKCLVSIEPVTHLPVPYEGKVS